MLAEDVDGVGASKGGLGGEGASREGGLDFLLDHRPLPGVLRALVNLHRDLSVQLTDRVAGGVVDMCSGGLVGGVDSGSYILGF